MFATGPDDSPERIERVLAVLRVRCGEGGYDFIGVVPEHEDAAAADELAALPVEEQTRLLTKVFEESCRYLREWLAAARPTHPYVSRALRHAGRALRRTILRPAGAIAR